MHGTFKVLHVNSVEERELYREAVAEIIRDLQSAYKLTHIEISEAIDASLGTISNAANKKADLNPVYLSRIGRVFGVHHLDPYARLAGGRFIQHNDAEAGEDIMPVLMRVGMLIAEARAPSSPGGNRETLRQRLGYLSDLCRLRRELDALIFQIENERESA